MLQNFKILLFLVALAHNSSFSTGDNTFNLAFKWVLLYEGDCSDDYGDPGGLTCWGITHSEYAEWRRRKGLPLQSVTKMPQQEAKDIYFANYWHRNGVDRLSPRVAIAVFDWEVNSGRGVITLQKILGVKNTGYVDDDTLNAANAYIQHHGNEDVLLNAYFAARNALYRSFAAHGQSQFLRGWMFRSDDLKRKLGVE